MALSGLWQRGAFMEAICASEKLQPPELLAYCKRSKISLLDSMAVGYS